MTPRDRGNPYKGSAAKDTFLGPHEFLTAKGRVALNAIIIALDVAFPIETPNESPMFLAEHYSEICKFAT